MSDYLPQEITKHLTTIPPDILYHYTGQQGLLGIVETASLWATKVQYMNDTKEFGISLEIAREELNTIIDEIQQRKRAVPDQVVYHELLRSLIGLETVNLFAVCFCQEGDLLSQWRGYTGGRQGYAIGFITSLLNQAACTQSFFLGKCIYEREHQRQIVRVAIDYCVQKISSQQGALGGGHGPLADILFKCGALFKDSSFDEEKEWRLVSPQIFYNNENLCFKPGDSMIIPYYKLKVLAEGVLPIQEVFVGPCPHMESSLSSVEALLMKNGLTGPLRGIQTAFRSKIPFRNW